MLAAALTLAAGCSDDAVTNPGRDGAPTDAPMGGDAGTPDGGAPDAGPAGDAAAPVTQAFVVLHTNDLHSHLMGFGPESEYTPATPNDDKTVGGLARLAAKIKADRAAAGDTPVLLLDAGDFMMGTPFHIISLQAAAELVEMNKLKYDAIAVGNHELDWGPLALMGILGKAAMNGVTIPILASNMTFPADDHSVDALKTLTKRKLVKDVGKLKVGFFGLLGLDAAQVSALKAPLTFDDIAVASRAMVMDLRQNDKVDLVIALSHSGIDPSGMGEDRKLADDAMVNAAGGIDIIISGHTHDTLPMPVKTGKTWIVQTGAYGMNLGKLQMTATKTATGTTLAMTKYDLELIDDSITGDAETQTAVDGYIAGVDMALMPAMLTYKMLMAETATDVTRGSFAESGIGDLVTDAYLATTAKVQPGAAPVLAIDASGDLRDDIKKGNAGKLWFADLFRVQPLGIGKDMQPGFPLVTFYVNGKDLKSGFEFSAAAKTLGKPDYFLHVAGATVAWKESATVFKRVTSIQVGGADVAFDNTATCYKVVTNIYVAGLLGLIQTASGGVLSVTPKAADCMTPVDPSTQLVNRTPTAATATELKNWQALIGYVGALPDSDGNMLPNIPAAYGMPAGRITITP